MANKKKRKNKKYSTHKSKGGAYIKKKLPHKRKLHTTKVARGSSDKDISGIGQGSRVVNVEKLTQYTERMNEHATRCDGSISLHIESRDGLASVFTGECSTCQHKITLETSRKVKALKITTGKESVLFFIY